MPSKIAMAAAAPARRTPLANAELAAASSPARASPWRDAATPSAPETSLLTDACACGASLRRFAIERLHERQPVDSILPRTHKPHASPTCRPAFTMPAAPPPLFVGIASVTEV